MNKKITNIILGIIGIGAVVLLFVGSKPAIEENPIVSKAGTEIPCLPNGHQQITQHIHPVISIFVDGEEEVIPGNIGIEGACMREIHTHDTTGTIHIETKEPDVVYTLSDFFAVWDRSIDREGYAVVVTEDGEEVNPEELVLEDLSEIEIIYTSLEV